MGVCVSVFVSIVLPIELAYVPDKIPSMTLKYACPCVCVFYCSDVRREICVALEVRCFCFEALETSSVSRENFHLPRPCCLAAVGNNRVEEALRKKSRSRRNAAVAAARHGVFVVCLL